MNPTNRIGIILNEAIATLTKSDRSCWVSYVLLLAGVTLAVVILNPLHELAHYWFWTRSGISACLTFNETIPEGGVEAIRSQSRMVPGVIAGPAFNVLLGLVMIPLYHWARSLGFRRVLFVLITCTLLVRPVNVTLSAISGESADEILLLQNLSLNSSAIEGWLWLLAFTILPTAYFVVLAFRASNISRWVRIAIPVAVLFGLVVVRVISWFVEGPVPGMERVGDFCEINFGPSS